jgi:hypothetical protein
MNKQLCQAVVSAGDGRNAICGTYLPCPNHGGSQQAVEEAERVLLHLRASIDELEPVVTIGRMLISAFREDPEHWRASLPVVVVARIDDYLKEHS